MSSYDVLLTWTRANVEVLAWLLTWSDDVIRWRQMTSATVFGAWLEHALFISAWRRSQKPSGTWRCVQQRLKAIFLLQANRWSTWPIGRRVWPMDELHMRKSWRCIGRILKHRRHVLARVNAIDSRTSRVLQIAEQWGRHGSACGYDLTGSRDFLTTCRDVPELLAAHVGAWACCWGPSFWLFVAGGCEARLWCWFHQAKQGFAQIWRVKSRLCLSLWILDTAPSHDGCEMPWSLDPAEKHVWLLMVVCTWYSPLLARDVLFDAKNEVWLWYHVKYKYYY